MLNNAFLPQSAFKETLDFLTKSVHLATVSNSKYYSRKVLLRRMYRMSTAQTKTIQKTQH